MTWLFTECYDVVVSIGAFIPGHLNEDCYEELIRVTKKGEFNETKLK